MKYRILFLLSLCFTAGRAQESRFSELWKNITLAPAQEKPVATDTMVVMGTTRLLKSPPYFFDHENVVDNEVQILLAVCKHERWRIYVMENLKAAADFLPANLPWVMYVEGVGKNFPLGMYRAAGMATQYKVNVLFFDYPTLNENLGRIRNYYFARNNAKLSAHALHQYISNFNQYTATNSIITRAHKTLFIHSMGAQLFKTMTQQNFYALSKVTMFDRLILNASCVPRRSHNQWLDSVKMAKAIMVNYNRKDWHLKGARLITGKIMLGTKPKSRSKQAQYVNLVSVLGKKHNGFLNKPGEITIPLYMQTYFEALFYGRAWRFPEK